MDDQGRLDAIVARAKEFGGLSEETYERLLRELDRATPNPGFDSQGRIKMVMFDARSYDKAAFNAQLTDQFVMTPIAAALDLGTVRAAEGHLVACLFVNDRCDEAVIEALAAAGIKLIALRCAGYNNVDLDACRMHGISVVRVPAYSPHAVAEHSVALMMMLNRHLHQAYVRNRTGSFVLDGLTGFDMHGKTVGVIGTGKIGRCLIDIMGGFGCRVLAVDIHPPEDLAQESHVEVTDLERLLKESDIISLHVPLSKETRYLIDRDAIQQMKPGVMLINTSRGGLVDTRALIDGLKSGKIGAAGLDVYEEEAGVFFHDLSDQILTDDVLARLMTFNNVVVTSHQAFLTNEALSEIARTTVMSLEEFAAGKTGSALTFAVD